MKISHSELAELIIKTFKQLANFSSDEYDTNELIDRLPEQHLEALQLRFENLMETFKGIQFFDISEEKDLMNWFTIAEYESKGIDNAIADYHNMC